MHDGSPSPPPSQLKAVSQMLPQKKPLQAHKMVTQGRHRNGMEGRREREEIFPNSKAAVSLQDVTTQAHAWPLREAG